MKSRKTGGRPASGRPGRGPGAATKAEDAVAKSDSPNSTETPESPKKPVPEVVIDFDRIHEVMKGLQPEGMFRDPAVPPALDAFLRRVSGRN